MKKKYVFLSALLAPAAFILFMLISDVLGTDNLTLLKGDLTDQYEPFIRSFIRVLKGSEDYWYSFSFYFGNGTALTHAYYSLSPFNLFYLIDSVPFPAMTAFILCLKYALMAAGFNIFTQKILKCSGNISVLFSLSYALCCFSASEYFCLMWLDALVLMPFIALFIYRLWDSRDFLPLIPLYFLLFTTNFYMGYIAAVFSCILFLHSAFYDKTPSVKLFIDRLIRFGVSACLGAGLGMAVLMPAALFLVNHAAPDNTPAFLPNDSVPELINALTIGQNSSLNNHAPLIYAGLPVALLLPFYFICKKIPLREKLVSAASLVFYLISFFFLPLYYMLHAFDTPDFYNHRYSWCVSFLLICLAARVFPYIFELPRRVLFITAAVLGLLYGFLIPFMPKLMRSGVTNSNRDWFCNLMFLAYWVILFALAYKYRNKRRLLSALCLPLIVLELGLNMSLCTPKSGSLKKLDEDYRAFDSAMTEMADTINSKEHFRRVKVNNNEIYNAPAMFGYPGMITFSSSDAYAFRTAICDLGITSWNRSIRDCGYTGITEMLFSCGYLASYSPEGCTISENSLSLPLGYMVSDKLMDYTPGEDPFDNQEALLASMTGREWHFFSDIPEKDIKTYSYCLDSEETSHYISYYRTSKIADQPEFSYTVPAKEGCRALAYFFINKTAPTSSIPFLVSETEGLKDNIGLSHMAIIRCLANEEDNTEKITVVLVKDISPDSFIINKKRFVYYDDTELKDAYDELSKNVYEPAKAKGGDVRGSVTATEDKPLMFTSIPYEPGWMAYVDGVETPVENCMNEAFICLHLTPGTHDVRLVYTAPGKKAGLALSLISLMISLILLVFRKKFLTAQQVPSTDR